MGFGIDPDQRQLQRRFWRSGGWWRDRRQCQGSRPAGLTSLPGTSGTPAGLRGPGQGASPDGRGLCSAPGRPLEPPAGPLLGVSPTCSAPPAFPPCVRSCASPGLRCCECPPFASTRRTRHPCAAQQAARCIEEKESSKRLASPRQPASARRSPCCRQSRSRQRHLTVRAGCRDADRLYQLESPHRLVDRVPPWVTSRPNSKNEVTTSCSQTAGDCNAARHRRR